MGVFLGDVTKRTCFLFWPNLTGPGRQCNESCYWLKLFLETRRSAASVEPLTDLLGCLESTLCSKNPILLQIQKIAENALFPTGGFSDSDNSPLEHDSELFEASKDSWSLVDCTEIKRLRFGIGVFGGHRQKKGRFCFSLVILLWRHNSDNGRNCG